LRLTNDRDAPGNSRAIWETCDERRKVRRSVQKDAGVYEGEEAQSSAYRVACQSFWWGMP